MRNDCVCFWDDATWCHVTSDQTSSHVTTLMLIISCVCQESWRDRTALEIWRTRSAPFPSARSSPSSPPPSSVSLQTQDVYRVTCPSTNPSLCFISGMFLKFPERALRPELCAAVWSLCGGRRSSRQVRLSLRLFWKSAVNAGVFLKLCSVQVWRLGERKPGGRHALLALALGDCDWLVFLHVWRRPPVADRSSSPAAGHR